MMFTMRIGFLMMNGAREAQECFDVDVDERCVRVKH